ncbi:NAD(P)H-dependent oxidoreductase subunit E [Castellaniella sp. S9]|uniref:NAD(P)H-dependent oxidoreductase subunit E n=1 Tax=Castellaniella sp. S9 TaxID=2993652 RepID=UPI0022B44773|nr:NAD(P)H-dependent oxidoreductase subunit E [Castellaniella sp. S9]
MDAPRNTVAACPLDPTELVRDILLRHAGQEGSLLPILHAVQDAIGYIPDAAVVQIAAGIQRSRAEVHGVVGFYSHFRRAAPAPVRLEVCRAESCQACGGQALYAHAEARVAAAGTAEVSLDPVYCLGLCAQSPAVMINGRPHARMSPEKLDALLAQCPEA